VPDRSEEAGAQADKIRLPLILSFVGHIGLLTLLVLFMAATHPPPQPLEKHGIAITFAPIAAQQAALAPPTPIEPLAPPTVASQPPEEAIPPPPDASAASVAQVPVVPPEQTVTAETPPPSPPKPAIKPKPKYVVRRQEEPQPPPTPSRYVQALPPAASAASQYSPGPSAAAPAASVPGPDPAVNYGALISAWFKSHALYPDSARERGEEGNVMLHLRVDHYGRVIDYALVTSTGYADLDRGVEQMMSGARLPPFPAGMTVPEIEFPVTIRFSLTR
jgi:periplasmic protein TonB